nr:hypothetical protein [Actinomadura physcomitrii]
MAGEHDGDPPVQAVLGQRGVQRSGEPAAATDRDVLGGGEPGGGQRALGERVAGPDGRRHPQRDQLLDPRLGIDVVDGPKDDGLDAGVARTPGTASPTTFEQWCAETLKPAVLS